MRGAETERKKERETVEELRPDPTDRTPPTIPTAGAALVSVHIEGLLSAAIRTARRRCWMSRSGTRAEVASRLVTVAAAVGGG